MTERNEFMKFIPQDKLEQIARDAKVDGLEAASALAESELQRRRDAIAFAALSLGVYTGDGDEVDPTPHLDSKWAVELDDTNIERGRE